MEPDTVPSHVTVPLSKRRWVPVTQGTRDLNLFLCFQGDLRAMWSEPFVTVPPAKYQTI